MANKVTNKYDDSSIQILEGLEAVRKRPGMYISSTDSRGLHHLVWEIVDNAIDEALSGYGNKIIVTIEKDNSITVRDFGRGYPVGKHESGRNTTEVILTVLHAGGKFSSEGGYRTAGGLHGVGASVVNALSSFLEIEICRDGKKYYQHFSEGGSVIGPLKVIGKSSETGSKIHFLPDPTIFSTTEYSFTTICERMKESAFLLKGITMEVYDLRNDKHESFLFEDGLKSFVEDLNENKKPLHPVIHIEGTQSEIDVEVSLQYVDSYSETILSFVNLVRTSDGGTHETGFKTALTRIFNDYARKYQLLKQKDKNLDGVDIREGLSAVISIKVPEHLLQFESQVKSKLGTSVARNAVDNVVGEKLSYFLEENKEIAENLVRKMIKASQVREAARKAREGARKGTNKRQEKILSGKLAPAQSKDKKKNELYLVEGDSAGGSAKKGRDRKYQAILPLRGKVINTEKATKEDILKNEEIATIINTVGAGFGADFDIRDCNYDKIVIMTDADTDGAHIQVLLLTFFYRYMKPLIQEGKVYIALPPLYKVSKKDNKKMLIEYAWDDEELEQAKKKVGRGYMIQRYKGLGEMNADQLWETTMNPETRTLIQVTIDDGAIANKRVSTLMGDKVEPRRDWIEENVQFSLEDNYTIEK